MVTNYNNTGDLSKTKKLIAILKKCNGKAAVGNSEALISPRAAKILLYCGLLILVVGLFIGSYIVQPYISLFFGIEKIAQVLMMGILILSFMLSVKDIITVLYTTDDLELLLPMPFSATQIVMAKCNKHHNRRSNWCYYFKFNLYWIRSSRRSWNIIYHWYYYF